MGRMAAKSFVTREGVERSAKQMNHSRDDNRALVEPINALVKGGRGQLQNYFHASLKLERKGGKVRRIYGAAQTLLARVLVSTEVTKTNKERLLKHKASLNPFALKQEVTRSLKAIEELRRNRR
jgi:hypothetical protein